MVQLTQDGAEKKLAAEEISAEVLRMMKGVAEVRVMNIFELMIANSGMLVTVKHCHTRP